MNSWISRLILRKAVHSLHITWRTIRTIFRYQTEQPEAVKQPFNWFFSKLVIILPALINTLIHQ